MNDQQSDIDVDRWRLALESANRDDSWVHRNAEKDERREQIREEMLEFLDRYQTGAIDSEQFKATFDCKTRTTWQSFGLKGMSGAMFLNMMVKNIPDAAALSEHLRTDLRVPSTVDEARQRMTDLFEFLERFVSSGQIRRRALQPARTPFFLSAWWHVQETERWPIYYSSARRLLESYGAYQSVPDPVNDYLTFREAFLAVASALSLASWQLEHLCVRLAEQPGISGGAGENGTRPDDVSFEPGDREAETATHTQVQWLLARIGRSVGCRVWIASNDQSKRWNGARLGDLSLPSLPALGVDPESERIIKLIDVLWIKGAKQVAAAFEIEHTTSIYSGLLRMSDLVALSPNLNFPLYIVAPDARMEQVKRELSRPTFQTLQLSTRCGYFSDEALIGQADQIMKWANDPSAIDRLASRVQSGEGED